MSQALICQAWQIPQTLTTLHLALNVTRDPTTVKVTFLHPDLLVINEALPVTALRGPRGGVKA